MSVLKCRKITPARDEVREMLIASADYTSIAHSELLPQPTRKRRGSLSGLTIEEKIRRKKLKNREAAQNSRDKKKAYVENLENAVTTLQEENADLSSRLCTLLEENRKLQERNMLLERQLDEMSVKKVTDKRSAEPSPQQKDLVTFVALTQMIVSIFYSTLTISTGSKRHTSLPISMNYQNWLILFQMKLSNWRKEMIQTKWWGPYQKSWNPLGLIKLKLAVMTA